MTETTVLITCRADTANAITAYCIARSHRVEVTPLPDDIFGIQVRSDAEPGVIALLNELEG